MHEFEYTIDLIVQGDNKEETIVGGGGAKEAEAEVLWARWLHQSGPGGRALRYTWCKDASV